MFADAFQIVLEHKSRQLSILTGEVHETNVLFTPAEINAPDKTRHHTTINKSQAKTFVQVASKMCTFEKITFAACFASCCTEYGGN
jgi:hypothetical protein